MNVRRSGLLAAVRVAAILGLLVSLPAVAESVSDRISISEAYVRAVPPVVKTTAAFMQISNAGTEEHFIVGASSPVAETLELHMHSQDGQVMRMRRIVHIHLPPGQTIALQPGGLHIMLFDLRAPLQPGSEVPLSLEFDDGSTHTATAVVRRIQDMM